MTTDAPAPSPKVLARTILSEPVLAAMRKEVRRSTGHNCEETVLAGLLRDTVIRADAM